MEIQPVNNSGKKLDKLTLFREVRDTLAWTVVVVWAGISIYDMRFKPKQEEDHAPAIVKEFDVDGDGKISREERDSAIRLIEEFGKWKKLNNQIQNNHK